LAKAQNHLLRRLLKAWKRVVLQIMPLEKLHIIKAKRFRRKWLLLNCFVLLFRGLLKRKRVTNQLARRNREKYKQSLIVKSYSALLFNMIESNKKKPLK
jgi:hypothetical protein